jgi:hypothetical protein
MFKAIISIVLSLTIIGAVAEAKSVYKLLGKAPLGSKLKPVEKLGHRIHLTRNTVNYQKSKKISIVRSGRGLMKMILLRFQKEAPNLYICH